MTKIHPIASSLLAAGLVATAGAGLVSGRQDAGKAGRSGPDGPKPGYPPAAKVAGRLALLPASPRADDARGGAPALAGGSVADAPRVLFLRLKSAIRVARGLRDIPERGPDALAAREEVDAQLAQLEAKRDEFQDQVELLEAQLAIRKADIAMAQGQLDQAMATFKQAEGLFKRGLTGDNTLQGTRLDVEIRAAELQKRRAEGAEVEVRIGQATRRFKVAEGLVNQVNDLVVRAFPEGATPGAPAPAPAR